MRRSKLPKLQSFLVGALLLFQFSSPCRALVEPEVEAWQELVAAVEQSIPMFGSSLPSDAVQGVGNFASSMAYAPLSELMEELELRRDLKFKYFTPWHVKDKTAVSRCGIDDICIEMSILAKPMVDVRDDHLVTQ